jgi:glyoxylate reductase
VRRVPRVHVTTPLPEAVMAVLAREFELVDEPAGVDGLVTTPRDRVDAALLDLARPRVVANYAVGYDNVDLAAATARGVVVANTPDVLTRATAELTIALILALLRRVAEGDRLVRSGKPWRIAPTFMLGRSLAGLTLGIVGLGRIGREVARLAEAHGMRVLATRATPLAELLAEADVVTLHVPLTAETRHLVNVRRMKPGAVLVNTSRGPVVDEEALVAALRDGHLGGAALDVYEREPEVHPGLLELENVVLTPHIGSATHEAREAMGMLCVEALREALVEGRVPRNALNPGAWRG